MTTWYVGMTSDEKGDHEIEPMKEFVTAEAAKAYVFDRITVAGSMTYKGRWGYEQFNVVPLIGNPFSIIIFGSAF